MTRCPVILVAEDQPDSVDLLKLAFSTSGVAARVNYVEDGEVAIEYLSGEEPFGDRVDYPLPAILLLDLKMPRRDGFQVLEWLRLQPGLRRLVVVVFSSSADPKDINRAFALGANSYVVKPGGFNELKETVRSLENYWLGLNQCPDCVPEASPPNGGRRVLLRNTTNGRYFRGADQWADKVEDAFDFERAEQAIQSAQGMDLEQVEVIAEGLKIKLRLHA